MKGRIYSHQKCPICGGILYHDETRGGLFCKNHPEIAASTKFIVRFGRAITKRFSDYHEAERFLTGLRFENDKGTFDIRDYRKDNPLGFENLANKWIEQKKNSKVKPKTIQSYTAYSGDLGRLNRRKSAACSGRSRPPKPEQSGHRSERSDAGFNYFSNF